MPTFRKVSPEEAATWRYELRGIWTDRLFHHITQGDNEGVVRLRRGWRVHIDGIYADFLVTEHGTLARALTEAVKARRVMRHVVRYDKSRNGKE